MEMKFPVDGLNTSDNMCAIHWHTIPSITGYNTNRNKKIICDTFFTSTSNALAEKAMTIFNRKPFMVTLNQNIIG